MVAKSRADYWADLDRAVEAERALHGRKPLKEKERQPAVKETKVSRTDPEAGYMVREGKPKGYLDHRTVDARHAIITDTVATPANVHDSIVYLSRLDRQVERFGFQVGAVGLDAGYATPGIARGLEERAILGITGYRNPTPPKPGMMRKSAFVYEADADANRCPEGQLLAYATTDRTGYRHYKSDPTVCRDCPLLASCTTSANATRLITRHVWAEARERTDANRKDRLGQGDLSPPQGNRRALLRRRQATSQPPLRPLPKSDPCARAMPARRSRPKHQENRPGAHRETVSPARLRPTRLLTSRPDSQKPKALSRIRKNPAENRRGLSAV